MWMGGWVGGGVMKNVQITIAILVGCVALFGAGYKLDCRWAKPSIGDHEVLAGDVRGMKLRNVQEALWQIEDRYRGIPQHDWAPHDLDRYRRLQQFMKCLQEGKKDCQYYQ